MKTIHKLALPDLTEPGFLQVTLPIGAKPLCIKFQRGVPTLWYETVVGAGLDEKMLFVKMTGEEFNDIPDKAQYLGTLLYDNDQFVLHYYIA